MTESNLPPFVQKMLRPEFYPHPVTEPIGFVQTHISYVFLTGDYAYKAKKPMDFGFLDYSTLEKRKHFCAEELRMNQRGAPGLYLELVPITQAGDDFELGGMGEVVEYAVKMRQFPETSLLSSLFEQGKLTEELLVELAKTIANFHKTCPTSDRVRSFGEVAQVRQAFDENYQQTEGYIGGPQTQQQFDETKAYTDRFFAERADLFTSRTENGWIRECHGDPHLGNICQWDNQLMLFDCIEFNDSFRLVDVMYDVAYIVMDLAVRDRPDLGAIFLSAYVEQTGDWEGLQVLPIYVNRQTYVRAKVTSFMLNDPGVPDEEKKKGSEKAALYYRLAWEYATPKPGKIFLTCGLSGSGKSTTARELARQMGGIYIRSDAVRKHLGGVPLDQRGGDDLYSPEMTQKTYDRLTELGLMLSKQGYTVILDAKYDRQAFRESVIEQANAAQIPVQIIHCEAPLEVLSDRLRQRTGDIADATADLLKTQSMEPFTDLEKQYAKAIDTTREISAQLR
jgi:uncharacterized protein